MALYRFLMALPGRIEMVYSAVVAFATVAWGVIDTFFSIPLFWDWGEFTTYLRFILWIGWILLLTQPKPIDTWVNKICKGLSYFGKYMAMLYRGGIIFKIITCMIWIPGMILQNPEFFRFFITIAGANFLVSNWMLKVGGGLAGWLIASSGLVMFIVWAVWLRSDEYKKELARSIERRGMFKGLLYQAFRDFIPKPTKWTCQVKGCGHKENKFVDVENGVQETFCEKCLARNPNAPWECPRCKRKDIYSKSVGCPGCGLPNPYISEHGKPAQIQPSTQETGQDTTTPQGTDTDSKPTKVPCPHPNCDSENDPKSDFCENSDCRKSLQTSSSTKVVKKAKPSRKKTAVDTFLDH